MLGQKGDLHDLTEQPKQSITDVHVQHSGWLLIGNKSNISLFCSKMKREYSDKIFCSNLLFDVRFSYLLMQRDSWSLGEPLTALSDNEQQRLQQPIDSFVQIPELLSRLLCSEGSC
jgi:hypothetical protein